MLAVVSDTVLQAAIGAIATIALAWISYITAKLNRKLDEVHKDMNGKLAALVDSTAKASKSEGKEEERVEQRARIAEQAVGEAKRLPPAPPTQPFV